MSAISTTNSEIHSRPNSELGDLTSASWLTLIEKESEIRGSKSDENKTAIRRSNRKPHCSTIAKIQISSKHENVNDQANDRPV